MEFVDPLPFFKSPGAWVIYVMLVFEIIRQFSLPSTLLGGDNFDVLLGVE